MSKARSIDSTWDKQEDLVFDEISPPVKVMYCGKIFNVKFSKIQQLGTYIGTGEVYVNFNVDFGHYFFQNGKLYDCEGFPSFRLFSGNTCYLAHWQDPNANKVECISLFATEGHVAQVNKQIVTENPINLNDFQAREAIIHYWDKTSRVITDPLEFEETLALMKNYNLKQDLVWD